jgi:hypothetical protein
MDHRTYLELLAGDTINDLSVLERVRLRLHLLHCASCRRARADFDELAAALSTLAPRREPPAALRAATLRAAVDGRAPRPARSWTRLAWPAATAVLALALVVLAVNRADLQARYATTQSALASAAAQGTLQSAAMRALTDPHRQVAVLQPEALAPAAQAWAVWIPGTTDAWLVASGLPAAPAGHVYRLWYADRAGPHGGVTFAAGGSGTVVEPFGTDLAGKTAAMVTLEPLASATAATPGPQVVFGTLPRS